jgi:hypothetical protein
LFGTDRWQSARVCGWEGMRASAAVLARLRVLFRKRPGGVRTAQVGIVLGLLRCSRPRTSALESFSPVLRKNQSSVAMPAVAFT